MHGLRFLKYFGRARLLLIFGSASITACGLNSKSEIRVNEAGKSQLTKIISIAPIAAKPGETVNVKGENLTEARKLKLSVKLVDGTVANVPLEIKSVKSASFVMPDGVGLGMKVVNLFQGQNNIDSFGLIADQADNALPILITEPAKVCSGISYIDRNGELQTGTKNCTAAPSTPTCSADAQIKCMVDGNGFIAASVASLQAGNIKSGVVIGGVQGSVQESPASCLNDGSGNCVVDGVNYKAAKMSNFDGTKILSGTQIAGVAGNLTLPAVNKVFVGTKFGASSTGSTGTMTVPGASNVLSGVTYGDPTELTTGTIASCVADASNCFLPAYSVMSQPLKAISYNSIDQTKMLNSLTVSGITGAIASKGAWDLALTFPGAGYYSGTTNGPTDVMIARGATVTGVAGSATLSPPDCVADGATGCVAVSAYPAALASGATSKILAGQTLAGITGNVTLPAVGKVLAGTTFGVSGSGSTGTLTLPSATNVLSGTGTFGDPGELSDPSLPMCNALDSGCYVPTYVATTQPLKAISYDAINSSTANIRSGTNLGGVAGTLADCSTNAATGCVTTSTYKSADLTNLSAGNIKSGVTIAGTAGQYPSSSFPLTGSSGSDLTTATFDVQIKTSGTFQYFGSDGARYTGTGDSDILAANIASSVDIFGATGSLIGAVAPDPWNVRVGVTVNGVTGKLKVNCRNRVSTSSPTLYNYDGAIGSIGTGGQTGGSVIDIWDTIDDYNNGQGGVPGGVVASWSSSTDCYGVESGAGDDNVWKDVTTTNGTTASTCAATSGNCTMQDKITGLWWSKQQASGAWNTAWNTCVTTLNNTTYSGNSVAGYNGQTGWRLPTQKELMESYTHGIRSAARTNWITEGGMNSWFWSGSSQAANRNYAWLVDLAYGFTNNASAKNVTLQVVCVRD
jgi:hypothetical protein